LDQWLLQSHAASIFMLMLPSSIVNDIKLGGELIWINLKHIYIYIYNNIILIIFFLKIKLDFNIADRVADNYGID
jgi:hypothetical protein